MKYLALIAALAIAATAGAANAATCKSATSGELTTRVVQTANSLRTNSGFSRLKASPTLSRAAEAHACDMARNGFFDHRGSNGSTVVKRVSRQGYKSCVVAENIAWGYDSPDRVMQGWRGSAGHRKNLLYPSVREVGVAYADHGDRRYWVMVLARRC
jgi:uncharacterized protein YkwD